MNIRQLARLARGQRGLFTRTDARRCGYSDDQIRRRIAAGEWRRVVGPVLTVGSARREISSHLGQRGLPKVRRLVRAISGGERSAAERVLTGLLRRSGLTGWRVNVPIVDGRGLIGVGDLVFEVEKVVIEVDGWAHHSTVERFQRDRSRQNRLVREGWTVLRFTWRDLNERPAHGLATVRAVRAVLAAATRDAASWICFLPQEVGFTGRF